MPCISKNIKVDFDIVFLYEIGITVLYLSLKVGGIGLIKKALLPRLFVFSPYILIFIPISTGIRWISPFSISRMMKVISSPSGKLISSELIRISRHSGVPSGFRKIVATVRFENNGLKLILSYSIKAAIIK